MSTQLPKDINIKMLLANSVEYTTLACVPAPYAEQPVSNVLLVGSHKVMRVSSTAFTFTATWSENKIFNIVVLDKHNFTENAIVTFYIMTDTGGDVVDSYTFTDIDTCLAWHIPIHTPLIGKQVKIVVSDDTNTDGYLQIGRVAAGEAFVPVYTIQAGATLQHVDTGKTDRAKSGALVVFPGNVYREIKIALDFVSREERDYLSSFFKTAGIRSSIYISCYPGWGGLLEKDHHGFFHLGGETPLLTHQFLDSFSLSFSLTDSEIIS